MKKEDEGLILSGKVRRTKDKNDEPKLPIFYDYDGGLR